MKLNPSNCLKVSKYKIKSLKTDKQISIASLSDLHISTQTDVNKLIFIANKTNELKPDYICFLGDTFDTPEEIKTQKEKFAKMLKTFNDKIQIFLIIGNHDYIMHHHNETNIQECTLISKELDTYSFKNLHILNDASYETEDVFFMGYTQKENFFQNRSKNNTEDGRIFYNEFKSNELLYKSLPKDKIKIGLLHSPNYLYYKPNLDLLKDYDLLLSGHAHEGCTPIILDDILPGNFGIISPKKALFPKYARGLIKLNKQTAIINGGIVKIQNSAPKLMHPLNNAFNMQMDLITISPNEEKYIQKTKERFYYNPKKK